MIVVSRSRQVSKKRPLRIPEDGQHELSCLRLRLPLGVRLILVNPVFITCDVPLQEVAMFAITSQVAGTDV
jgi:hypothetical protein